ncbi:MAG: antibiotic biosynthesis monooxygenase [Microbacteriaceae bacterium]
MPHTCTVIVPITPLPGSRERVLALFDAVVPTIREGAGVLRYDVFVGQGQIVLIEEWVDRDSWQAHFGWEPIQRLKRELPDLVEMPVERWELYERPIS